MSKLAFLRSFC